MTFGHPTGAWPECDPRLNGTLPMDLSVGLITIKNRLFLAISSEF